MAWTEETPSTAEGWTEKFSTIISGKFNEIDIKFNEAQYTFALTDTSWEENSSIAESWSEE